jgi:predicted MPP superfamily phosphohydrolase
MRLIHLSDIHFTAGGTWDPDEDQRDELLADVGVLVDDGGTVDGILIGGDIAFSGAKAEYDVAAEWIEKVRVRSGCPEGAIWVVPGNHDIDRNVHDKNRARTKMLEELRHTESDLIEARLAAWLNGGDGLLSCLDAYNRFCQDWVPPTTAKQPHWTDLTLGLDGLDVCLTGINTVLTSDTRDWPAPQLIVGKQQCSLQRAPNRVHIAFAHHPPSWIKDWPAVAGYLRRAHLVIFGHEHYFRVEQEAPGLTVTVYAGAVGPERPQPDPAPRDATVTEIESDEVEYRPSWNLIEIVRDGDELVVTIDPRVWSEEDPEFVRHPGGIQQHRVRLDLKPCPAAAHDRVGYHWPPGEGNDDETTPPKPSIIADVEHPGTNSSPLIPDSMEVQEGVPLPTPAERSELRALAVAFMRLTPTRRAHIAEQLGVHEGLAELELSTPAEGREILRRVRAANKIDELKGLIDA